MMWSWNDGCAKTDVQLQGTKPLRLQDLWHMMNEALVARPKRTPSGKTPGVGPAFTWGFGFLLGMGRGGGGVPPPPLSRNHLAQEPTPGSAVEFSHHFFYQGSGFFMFLVDVGQLFRCAGHHFMCVTTGPPIRGDPISHSQAHIPLKPLPPALYPFPEATSP